MKSFRFSLEAVLETRRAQETEASRQLAVALEKEREAMARSREALSALDLLLEGMAAASGGRFSAADRERSIEMRRAQEKICAQLRIAAQECTRLTEAKRAAVLQARRNRELLERLKGAQQQAWQREAVRLEQHQFDEFAMTRRFQAAQQEQVLC